MTDFNLEQFKAGRIAITENDMEARFLGLLFDKNKIIMGMVAAIMEDDQECIIQYDLDGISSFPPRSKLDKMKPEKKKLYIVVRHERDANFGRTTSPAYESREDAEETGFCTEPHTIVEVEIEV